ncbi:MAG: ATPase [Oscillospiraceae bacterium]|nr:ATPase [Oscillospiraceae bacterium]
MKWFIGVDGGGTKTASAISLPDGKPIAETVREGCSYQMLGVDGAVTVIIKGVHSCLEAAGIALEDCAGCCLGVPCYGENAENDAAIKEALRQALSPVPVHIVNDVEVGWAGALACRPGIHIVAGTGAIAFGKGLDQKTARCGGWNEFFGDEGSCYWVGREAMSLFTKQADGRIPRGPLYAIVRQALGLSEDMRFIDIVVNDLAPCRDKVAAFQLYASQAAESGDPAAVSLYQKAARELALLASALRKELVLPETASVTYSGGLFRAGGLILDPLAKALDSCGCVLQKPERSALEGALLLAIEQFHEKGR